uniref:Uncharacterized protein n=1 Tax=uncultured Candidatus Melainabacteria bacterium TaxID=2682970 RepID=A0A650EJP2_9BACT|nr:hypothetical protein Melaina855_0190 [uncultured Candidatus Melainabacteria bacterium]
MSVKPIIPSVNSDNNANKIKLIKQIQPPVVQVRPVQKDSVSFKGNPIVATMDFIETGGYAAAFIIQDGIGFITPRVGKGLLRGGKEKKDANGNVIIGKDGKPERELNWQLARKEFLREMITGPSAFLIPLGMLSFINKYFGTGNNVKLNYLDSMQAPFAKYVVENIDAVKNGTAAKAAFYEKVYADVIEKSINSRLPEAERMSADEIGATARDYASRQVEIEKINANKSLNKKARKEALAQIESVEDSYMKLRKSKIGGAVNELAIHMTASNGEVKGGSISELVKAMNDYFGDAVKNTKKSLKDNVNAEQIENAVKQFTRKRMGSRVLTNLGIFGTVAAFYTQIPKLYNMGMKGNPALAAEEESPSQVKKPEGAEVSKENKKDVPFTGMASMLEKTGEKVFNGKISKSISDIFELHGPIISGTAMPVLLYGFCIPPRLQHAQDKYDYGEIVVRDMTAFTALLFGAKAIARLFSDGFTKITGLALNNKNLEGRNVFQKVVDYLNPTDKRHSVLSSKQLDSKYTNLEDYKGGVNGFVEFIEQSGGNIKKAFGQDKNVKAVLDEILTDFNGKSFKDATVAEVKKALKAAHENETDLIKKFYSLFKGENGLLSKAKTCNSSFGFISTIALVPGLIIWLTDVCEKMTERRTKEDKKNSIPKLKPMTPVPSNSPTMAGFIGASVK